MAIVATATVLAAALVLLIGGLWLLTLGGTVYYALSGGFLLAAGLLRMRGDWRGKAAFLLFLALTIAWTVAETGGNGWGLLPRLPVPCLLGLFFLPQRLEVFIARHRRKTAMAVVAGVAILVATLALWPQTQSPAIRFLPRTAPTQVAGWDHFGGTLAGTRFSPADQINTANVADLKPAWTFHTGTLNSIGKGGMQATPIYVDGALFTCTGFSDILSIDPDTGRQLWRHASGTDLNGVKSAGCRGVAFYAVPGMTGPCARRIIASTVDARLIAVDSRSGQPCRDFGNKGVVSLLKGMGVDIPGYYYPTSAPTIARGRIIVGGWVTDNQFWGEPSGVIRAFDARTGAFRWAFDIGRPDDHGEPPAGQTYTRSTPNAWGPMSADETLGLVYAPIGNPTPDYFGAQRRPFDERYGTSVAAIDLETGKLRWVFQTVHHDLWDYDVPSQPTLLDIRTGGRLRKALLQPTKRGAIFLLDRETGKPIAPVFERPVPQDGVAAGERPSPTQPFSSIASLTGPALNEARMWGITPFDQLWCRIKFKQARYDGIFTPPGLTPSITYPGYLGGTNWGGLAVDLRTFRLVVNMTHVPNYTQLIPRKVADAMGVEPIRPGGKGNFAVMAQKGTPYAVTSKPFLSPLGIPCNEPPFGRIASIDIASGKLVWARTLGTTRDAGPLGIPSLLPLPTGMPNTGGPIATAGGLTFIGATQDRSIRAFESGSGRLLWSARLPSGGQATPMTFVSARSGRQYVIISAGGNQLLGSKLGDAVVAFALPGEG